MIYGNGQTPVSRPEPTSIVLLLLSALPWVDIVREASPETRDMTMTAVHLAPFCRSST